MQRTSVGLALLAAGGIMLLAVVIPGAPFSVKVVGVFLAAAGFARLGLPRRLTDWLRRNKDRLTEAVDPGAAVVAQTPRVPLEDLLASPAAGGVAEDERGGGVVDERAGGTADERAGGVVDERAGGIADERAAAPRAQGRPAEYKQPLRTRPR
jgi:hypothetical protein